MTFDVTSVVKENSNIEAKKLLEDSIPCASVLVDDRRTGSKEQS